MNFTIEELEVIKDATSSMLDVCFDDSEEEIRSYYQDGYYDTILSILSKIEKNSESFNIERKIIKKATEIEKELLKDNLSFCKSSYLMGALAYRGGDFDNN